MLTSLASLTLLGTMLGVVPLTEREAHAATDLYCGFPASVSAFTYNQNAFEADNSVIRLTTNNASEIGSAFMATPIPLTATTSFHAHFAAKIGPSAAGGDGLAFVLQNAATGAASLGTGAGGMGYGGLTPSVIVELDTFKNTGGDPNANHVGLMLNGSATTHTAYGTPTFTMAGAAVVEAWVDYDAVGQTISVYVGQTTTKPATPLVTHALNLFAQLGSQMFVGFTAATNTGTEIDEHDLEELELSTTGVPCECEGDLACSGSTPACATSGLCATCSATNHAACTGATPICDVPTNSCVGCLANTDCGGSSPICDAASHACRACAAADCTGTTKPVCDTTPTSANQGTCVICTQNSQCPATGTTRCNLTTDTCAQCLSATDCGGDTPICTNGVCQPCTSDSQCGGATPTCEVWGACGQCTQANAAACSGGTGVCDYPTGTCVACEFNSDCSGASPTCNVTTHLCEPCQSNADCSGNPDGDACVTTGMKAGSCVVCAADADCTSTAAPKCDTVANQCVACLTSGDCVAPTPVCDPSNLCVGCLTAADCSAASPVCDPTSSQCLACSNDYSATNPGPLPCPTAALPACQPSGTAQVGQCGVCSSLNDSACVTLPSTPVCIVASATCGCTADTDCNTGSYCDVTTVSTGVCTMGCTESGGVTHCATGEYCSKTDGTVGTCMTQPCDSNGDCKAPDPVCNTAVQPHTCTVCLNDVDCPTGKICNAADQCVACSAAQKGNCSASGAGSACLASGTCGCATDSDCGSATSGRVCNTKTNVCETGCRGSGGNGCPSGDTCSSKNGTAGECSGSASRADAGATTNDAGSKTADASLGTVDQSSSGCGCRTAPRGNGKGVGALAGLALGLALAARRRRRSGPFAD